MKNDYLAELHGFADYLITNDCLPEEYCIPQLFFNNNTLTFGTNSNYEHELMSFLYTNDPISNKNNLKILIGGLGTGKSTTITRCLIDLEKQLREGEKTYQIVILDFVEWEDELIEQELGEAEYLDRIWNNIASMLTYNNGHNMTIDEEIGSFWHWSLKQNKFHGQSKKLHSFFAKNSPYIRSINDKGFGIDLESEAVLRSQRNLLHDELQIQNSRDYAWYCALKLKYKLEANDIEKRFLIVDNLDHIIPKFQETIGNFSNLLSTYLSLKTLISVRPLTYERSIHAHKIKPVINHCSPKIEDVFSSKLNSYIKSKKLQEKTKSDLILLKKDIFGSKRYPLHKMVIYSSGLSVRIGLKNLSNFIKSPLILDNNSQHLDLTRTKVSTKIKAYVYGDYSSSFEDNIENIYSVNHRVNQNTILLKSRILDFIVRYHQGSVSVNSVYQHLKIFGYENNTELIKDALNELMRRNRPLIWVSDSFEVNELSSSAKLTSTSLGTGYYRHLIGELYYDEVCITNSPSRHLALSEMYEHHKLIYDRDYYESEYCITNYGNDYFLEHYPKELTSLSYQHWLCIEGPISSRVNEQYAEQYAVDKERGVWIINQFESLIYG